MSITIGGIPGIMGGTKAAAGGIGGTGTGGAGTGGAIVVEGTGQSMLNIPSSHQVL